MSNPHNDRPYLLGTHADEFARLERQHEIWREETERTLDDLGIEPGMRVLDLGCGPGFTSVDLLARVGEKGSVVAADRSEESLALLQRRIKEESLDRIETIAADALALDYRSVDPDRVFARWLFSFLPDPEGVVARFAEHLRPGTKIGVIDYWHYRSIWCEPVGPHFEEIFGAIRASYFDAGGSIDVAGRIPHLFTHYGIAIESLRSIGGATRPGTPYWEWITTFLRGYLPTLVPKGYLADDQVTEFLDWWREASDDDGVVLNLPPMLGIVGVVGSALTE